MADPSQDGELASERCPACKGDAPRLTQGQIVSLAARLPLWRVVLNHHLAREFAFPDFSRALDFAVQVGEVAERERHHPQMVLRFGQVTLTIFTYAVDGLTRADFVLAAKCDQLYAEG